MGVYSVNYRLIFSYDGQEIDTSQVTYTLYGSSEIYSDYPDHEYMWINSGYHNLKVEYNGIVIDTCLSLKGGPVDIKDPGFDFIKIKGVAKEKGSSTIFKYMEITFDFFHPEDYPKCTF